VVRSTEESDGGSCPIGDSSHWNIVVCQVPICVRHDPSAAHSCLGHPGLTGDSPSRYPSISVNHAPSIVSLSRLCARTLMVHLPAAGVTVLFTSTVPMKMICGLYCVRSPDAVAGVARISDHPGRGGNQRDRPLARPVRRPDRDNGVVRHEPKTRRDGPSLGLFHGRAGIIGSVRMYEAPLFSNP
jgi:hypothetical protein